MTPLERFLFVARCLAREEDGTEELRAELARETLSWEEVVAFASEALLTPVLGHTLSEKGFFDSIEADLVHYFRAVLVLNRERNERLLRQVAAVAGELNRIGVEPVLLKGLANLVTGVYPHPGTRVIRDIDLLVPEERLMDCADALLHAGYQPLEARPPGVPAISWFNCHYPALKHPAHGATVELHRQILPGHLPDLLPAAEILAAAYPAPVAEESVVHVPSLEHRAIHLVAHAQLKHANLLTGAIDLRALDDWVRMAAAGTLDYVKVREHFSRHKLEASLDAFAHCAQRLLRAELPGGYAASRKAQAGWRRFLFQMRHPRLGTGLRALRCLPMLVAREYTTLRHAQSHGELRRKLLTPANYWRNITSIAALVDRLIRQATTH